MIQPTPETLYEHYCQPDDINAILANIASHGFAIVPELLVVTDRQAVRDALAAHASGLRERNDFEGYQTERVYSLLARGRVLGRPAVLDHRHRFPDPGLVRFLG